MEIPVYNANSEDPDQMLPFAASDLDLHCLPMSFLRNARHKCVNLQGYTQGRLYRTF